MENSIQKIKKDIELKRKHNEEFLKKLKEKSIIYNAQKEKQKKYFQQNNISLLNKKRKLSKNDSINNDNEISNDLNNYTDDDYIEEFMNNSFISNRTFSNLNFCRPERFSYRKKKKKLSIKKEGGFTIYKTEKPIQKLESSNINITLGIKENNNTSIKESETKLGLFSNQKQDIFEEKDNNDLFEIKDNKKENDSKSGLFSDNSGFKLDNNKNTNSKSLFTSNISEINNKEVNKGVKIEEKKETENKKNESLFGDLDRKNINPEAKLVFGQSIMPQPDEKIIISETPKEKEKEEENINQKGESPPLINFSTINNKEEGKKEKDNITQGNVLFNLVEKKEENKIENTPSTSEKKKGLFGEALLPGIKEKEEEKTEKKDEKETISLFGIKEKEEEKTEKKDEKKETISLFGIKEKEEKSGLFGVKEKQEKKEETNKENKSSLFGFLMNKEEKIENTNTSLFNNGTNFIGNQEKTNETNNEKDEKKPTINLGLFNDKKSENIHNVNNMSLLGFQPEKEEKNKTEGILINNNNEETKNNNDLFSSKGSLANNPKNPFLNPSMSTNLPNIFSAPKSSSNSNGNDSNSSKPNSLFGNNTTNNNIFNNTDKKNLFEASNTGGMDMSPQMKSRNLFGNNNNNIPSNNLFNFTNNSKETNIFGAPINNVNNSNSLFNSNSNIFGNPSFFGNQQQSNINSSFSLGIKTNSPNFNWGRK